MKRFARISGTLCVVDTITGERAYAPHPRATPQCVLKVSGDTGGSELLPWPTRADLAAERRGNSANARRERRKARRAKRHRAAIARRTRRFLAAGSGALTFFAGKVGDTREPIKLVGVVWDKDEVTLPWVEIGGEA